jgi:hypothetical protein
MRALHRLVVVALALPPSFFAAADLTVRDVRA